MQQSPKPYYNNFKLRQHSVGVERRRNMSKLILEKGTPFPKPIEYSDIDQAMYDWVDKKINLVYDGKRLPTYKYYSTQRLSEYIQTWKDNDETNSPVLNFKTITREFNPQKGEIQGGYFNIPGHKDFLMFYVPVLEENGTEAFDKYTMKQPFGVNFTYSISIVTNKMEILNEMSEQMLYEFSAINCYIMPNDHPMSMSLEEISDNSEYTIDDRKYYSQTYKVKVKGYIIRKEDYTIERIPSRFVLSSHDDDSSGSISKRKKNRVEKVKFMDDTKEMKHDENYRKNVYTNVDYCDIQYVNDKPRNIEIYEETLDNNYCCDEVKQRYTNKVVKFILDFENCIREISFINDKEIILTSVETENVYDFRLLVNDEVMDFDNEIHLLNEDKITVKISRDDEYKVSKLTLVGYDPNEVVDNNDIPEVSIDEKITEEDIYVEGEEKNDIQDISK